MSGKQRGGGRQLPIPAGVSVQILGQRVDLLGPKGSLSFVARPQLKIETEDGSLIVKRKKNDRVSTSLHGLTRTLLANMVTGVEKGWEKRLELIGVGYKASLSGDKLILSVGFSKTVEIPAVEGIRFNIEDNGQIVIWGIDKDLVGQVAAKIRNIRPPEPYQGKGIRYLGEKVRRKAGKAGKVATK